MLVELTNHATQEKVQIEAEAINLDELTERFKINFSAEEFRNIIDNLNIPAEAKALLVELLGVSIKVGTVVLEVGKKILEIVRALVKKFPHITAGLILAATLSFLVSCIPFLGPLLSWICTPLLLLVGVGAGVLITTANKYINLA